jgi:hypothetical protein
MSIPLIELLAVALVTATLILFVLIAHDLGDDFRSIDRRLDRLDAWRAERRAAQPAKVPVPTTARVPKDAGDAERATIKARR